MSTVGRRAEVWLDGRHYSGSDSTFGTIVFDDNNFPSGVLIRLDDGRYFSDRECGYSLIVEAEEPIQPVSIKSFCKSVREMIAAAREGPLYKVKEIRDLVDRMEDSVATLEHERASLENS